MLLCSPEVDKREQNDPDRVNEVPEQGGRTYTKITLVIVAWNKGTNKHNYLQDNASKNVQTMKARQQVKRPTDLPRRQTEVKTKPLFYLTDQKVYSHRGRKKPQQAKSIQIAMLESTFRRLNNKATGNQHY